MRLASLWPMLRHYLHHPLGRRDRLGTLVRMVRWQIGSRLLGMAVAVPFVDGTRLLVRTGMHGATGNVYVGLMEFEDMAFVLHLLGKDDLFLDVGANVGVYSILAACRGAQVVAMEPVPATYEQLLDNIQLNRFQDAIKAKNVGVGSQSEELQFSTQTGPTNHVLVEGDAADGAVTVAVETLDEIAVEATMVKIDVEGFEMEVIRGAGALLKTPTLRAILIELNGLGARFGFSDADIHAHLLELGFSPVRYDPFMRRLAPLSHHQRTGNTLYVRSAAELEQRLRAARPVVWGGVQI